MFLTLLPPRYLSGHHFKQTSWQKTALAALACFRGRGEEGIREEREESEGKLWEKRAAQETSTEQGCQRQDVRGKEKNPKMSLQLSPSGRALGRRRERNAHRRHHPRKADFSEAVGRRV